jgi:hypothetical protein
MDFHLNMTSYNDVKRNSEASEIQQDNEGMSR